MHYRVHYQSIELETLNSKCFYFSNDQQDSQSRQQIRQKERFRKRKQKSLLCYGVCVSFRVILSDQLSKRNEQFVTAQWAISTAISKTWHFTKCYLFTFYYVKILLILQAKTNSQFRKAHFRHFCFVYQKPIFCILTTKFDHARRLFAMHFLD